MLYFVLSHSTKKADKNIFEEKYIFVLMMMYNTQNYQV
jgi:hypothetical protein